MQNDKETSLNNIKLCLAIVISSIVSSIPAVIIYSTVWADPITLMLVVWLTGFLFIVTNGAESLLVLANKELTTVNLSWGRDFFYYVVGQHEKIVDEKQFPNTDRGLGSRVFLGIFFPILFSSGPACIIGVPMQLIRLVI